MEFEQELQNIGEGWHFIVRQLHSKVLEIDPDIEVLQIKEKFGGLRYYYNSKYAWDSPTGKQITDLVAAAEQMCEVTCEDCGKDGKTVSIGGWLRTLCPEDADKALERRRGQIK